MKDPRPPLTNRVAIKSARKRLRDGAAPDHRLTEAEQAIGAAAIDAFAEALGGRDELANALLIASGDAGIDELTTLLLDPRYTGLSLRRLCALANLTVVDLFTAYRKAIVVRAHLEATKTIADKLLPVVEDVMTRAAPFRVPCGICRGTGRVADPDDPEAPPTSCEECLGHGEVMRLPDLDRQKLALELGQLVQRTSGVNVLQQNLQLQAPSASQGAVHGTLDQLQKVVGDLLSRPPILDVEPVDSVQEGPVSVQEGEGDAPRSPDT